MTKTAIAAALLAVLPTEASAQSRTFYDANGAKRKTRLATALIVATLALAAPAYAQRSVVQDVLSINSDLNKMCRGWSGDDPHTDEVCLVRLKVEELLGKLGYCLRGLGADSRWQKCGGRKR